MYCFEMPEEEQRVTGRRATVTGERITRKTRTSQIERNSDSTSAGAASKDQSVDDYIQHKHEDPEPDLDLLR